MHLDDTRGAQRLVYSVDTPLSLSVTYRQEGSTEASLQHRHPCCTYFGRQDHDSEVTEAVWITRTGSGGGGVVTCSSMSQGSSEAEK